MYKQIAARMAILVAGLFASVTVSAANEASPSVAPKQKNICGFKFAAVKGLEVRAKPIPKSTLRNRIDNDRFEACPYNVIVQYKKISMPLEFGQDINLERFKDPDEYGSLRTAYFKYGDEGWESAGEDIKIKKDEILTSESNQSITVSGILTRKNQQSGKDDYCFSIVVIGNKKYMVGAVCQAEKNNLYEINNVLSQKAMIYSDQQ